MFPLWLPFDINNNLYYIAFTYEVVVFIQLTTIGYSVCTLYVAFTTYLPALMCVIGETVESIEAMTDNKVWGFKGYHLGSEMSDPVADVIVRVIRQHKITNR